MSHAQSDEIPAAADDGSVLAAVRESQPRWMRFDEPDDDEIAVHATSAVSISVVALMCAFLAVALSIAALALAITCAGPYGYGYR